jgi:hypothetical protein
VKVETDKPMSAEELLTRHPWLNRYKGELVGWNRLIDELASQIVQRYAEHGEPLNAETFRIRQVKEKFGELRFYCDSSIHIQDLIQQATQKSMATCQECGAVGQLMQNDRLWLRTLCEQHAGDDYKPRPSLKKITVDGVTFTFFDEGQLDAVMPPQTAALNKKT